MALIELALPDRMRVLVAEDDCVQALVMTSFLQHFGIESTVVTDGAQAIRAVQDGDFDLVLMDCLMPVATGVDATLAVRRWEQLTDRLPVPIVAVTAGAMREDCDRCLAAGMDGVLLKPFTAQQLHDTIARHLPCEVRG
ncbi:MAG TPA: response regulator [Albitalea sp.]|uniref:response regulator n=1 Tax=Piscinibacter sp. TaxID=1903157 RepID=UPI002ED4D2E1